MKARMPAGFGRPDMNSLMRQAQKMQAILIPSIPAAPLFAFTLLYALFRLSLYSIASKSFGCALSLSFHIRLNDLDAFAYPSCSALSLCEQPLFVFSVIISHSSFPSHTQDSY